MVTRVLSVLVIASLTFLAGACGGDDGTGPGTGDPRLIEYAPELGIDLALFEELPSGLFYRDDSVGDGAEAVAGRVVTVHYVGYLTDGSIFDSSVARNQPFSFRLGVDPVIDGWEQGIPGMRVGGHRTLVIPPHLAYGATGVGAIPPNAVLVFTVELLQVS